MLKLNINYLTNKFRELTNLFIRPKDLVNMVQLETIFENDFVKIEYDKEKLVAWFTLKGLVTVESGIESFEAYLNVLPQKPIKAAIFNCIAMKGSFTKLNPWINENWYPPLIKQGYICWSMATTDIFSQFAGNMLINKLTPKEIKAKIFGSLESSEEWVYNYLDKNS